MQTIKCRVGGTRPLTFIFLFVFLWLTMPAEMGGNLMAQSRVVQGLRQITETDLIVENIRLNDSYDDVLKRLGEPDETQSRKVPDKSCGAAHTALTLHYTGLEIELYGTPNGRNFRVVSMKVTSAQWEVNLGVMVGMEFEEVLERRGKPEVGIADSGGKALIYMNKEKTMGAGLLFRRGKLASIDLGIHCDARTPKNSLKRTRN